MLGFEELYQIIQSSTDKLEIGSYPVELYEPIKYTLEAGGKRIRPVLTLAACNLFTDDISASIAPAIAIEIFHNFTLLHDDIMDKADLRRNRPTVHKKWNENIAILSGDAMVIKAYQQIIKTKVNLVPIVEVFNKTAIEVCEGQQLDMNFELRNTVSEAEYLEMIRLKTSVLLAASLEIGALAANASQLEASKLYEFGLNLGLAFQLQDDYLDTYGTTLKFGKIIGGDIVANKKTYLLVKAIELANDSEMIRINEILTKKDFNREWKVSNMISIFNKLNIRTVVKEKMDCYFQKSLQAIDSVAVEPIKKSNLKEFAKNLMERES